MLKQNSSADTQRDRAIVIPRVFKSREAVDDKVSKAVAAGGTTYTEPQDHGVMYGHGFQDLGGHI